MLDSSTENSIVIINWKILILFQNNNVDGKNTLKTNTDEANFNSNSDKDTIYNNNNHGKSFISNL